MLLFLSDLLTPLRNLVKAKKLFRSISHLKINYTKSYAVNVVTLPQKEVYHYQLAFLFTWKCDVIAYLGIQLLSDKLYVRNFCPYLKWDNVAFGHGVSHPGTQGPCLWWPMWSWRRLWMLHISSAINSRLAYKCYKFAFSSPLSPQNCLALHSLISVWYVYSDSILRLKYDNYSSRKEKLCSDFWKNAWAI